MGWGWEGWGWRRVDVGVWKVEKEWLRVEEVWIGVRIGSAFRKFGRFGNGFRRFGF